MKRPSFQFYPADWQANSNLRRCTHAEKGAWLDVMCLLHDQPEYGQIRWPLKEVAQAIGATPAMVRGLVTKGVLKGDDAQVTEPFVYTPRSGRKDGESVTLIATQAGPLWYSSRMVKDEYVRTIRGEGTRFGDDMGEAPKKPPKASPKPPLSDGPSSSSSSSSSTSLEEPPSGVSGAAKRAAKKCPGDFEVTSELNAWAAEKVPGLDLGYETDKFRDYTFKTARNDWPATWRQWMRKAHEDRFGDSTVHQLPRRNVV